MLRPRAGARNPREGDPVVRPREVVDEPAPAAAPASFGATGCRRAAEDPRGGAPKADEPRSQVSAVRGFAPRNLV